MGDSQIVSSSADVTLTAPVSQQCRMNKKYHAKRKEMVICFHLCEPFLRTTALVRKRSKNPVFVRLHASTFGHSSFSPIRHVSIVRRIELLYTKNREGSVESVRWHACCTFQCRRSPPPLASPSLPPPPPTLKFHQHSVQPQPQQQQHQQQQQQQQQQQSQPQQQQRERGRGGSRKRLAGVDRCDGDQWSPMYTNPPTATAMREAPPMRDCCLSECVSYSGLRPVFFSLATAVLLFILLFVHRRPLRHQHARGADILCALPAAR